MKEGNKKLMIGVLIAITLFVLLIIATIFLGIKSVLNIVLFLLAGLFILAIIGVIFYAVWYIFIRKQRFDATYQNKKNLIAAGRISKPDNMNDLYLSGDRGHSRKRLGKIIGYCRIQTIKKITEINPKTNEPVLIQDPREPLRKIEKFHLEQEEQDVFIVQDKGVIASLFSDPKVIRLKPHEHDDLIGDVTIYGLSIIPISEYYYLNHDYLNVREIDYSIQLEASRMILHEHIRDQKTMLDRAVGLDTDHKKDIEKKNLVEIPNLPSQQPQQ